MSAGKNYAAQAAIKCEAPAFRRFLKDCTKLPCDTKEEAAEALRTLCKIESRKELNETERGAANWLKVLGWFDLWEKGHGKNAAGKPHSPSVMGRFAFHRGSLISKNPFKNPGLSDEETDFDLWEAGWRRAAREYANKG